MSDYTTTAATQRPVTVDEAKRHLNITHTADDALLDQYIRAATNTLETRCNRCFVTQSRAMKLDNFSDGRYVRGRRIYPARSPLFSSTDVTITYVDTAGTTTTLPTTDYVVSTGDNPGYIAEAYNATWPAVYQQPNSVTVTYVAGHSTGEAGVPANIKLAVMQIVGHWYRNREPVNIGNITSELAWMIDALLEGENYEQYG